MMDSQEVEKCPFLSFRRIPDRSPGQAPESRKTKSFWTPALVRLRRIRQGDGVEEFLQSHQLCGLVEVYNGQKRLGF